MKYLLGLFVLVLMGNNDLPPDKYQNNPVPSILVVVSNPNSDDTCGKAAPGWVTRACEFERSFKGVRTPIVMMPNPCTFPEASDDDSYAHLLCHELGHVNGWNAEHNN